MPNLEKAAAGAVAVPDLEKAAAGLRRFSLAQGSWSLLPCPVWRRRRVHINTTKSEEEEGGSRGRVAAGERPGALDG